MVTPEETNSPPSPTSYAMSSKIMLSAIAILIFVVLLMVFLHLYARCYLLRARRRHILHRNRRATVVFFTADDPSTVIPTRGLDPAVLKSLPVFTFSDATHKDHPIECAVCLSEFEETESGRQSEEEQVVITISPEPVTETEPGSSSGLSDEPDDLRRKPAAIEVPRRNIGEFEDESTRNSPFRSPMSRMLSFTRMLSRDRRNVCRPLPEPPLYHRRRAARYR
ncbi:hypothetical protein Bca4012_004334 [Brassica carinata]